MTAPAGMPPAARPWKVDPCTEQPVPARRERAMHDMDADPDPFTWDGHGTAAYPTWNTEDVLPTWDGPDSPRPRPFSHRPHRDEPPSAAARVGATVPLPAHDITDEDLRKDTVMTITPGELRARTQPTILLRMTGPVAPAPGDTDSGPDPQTVFQTGVVVFAQYIGNGRLFLDPVDKTGGWAPHVVMASALNSTSEIITQGELIDVFRRSS